MIDNLVADLLMTLNLPEYPASALILEASLRENSPVIRAKALRAVSVIVEADIQKFCVITDKHVQSAVEDRFCDSSISVREVSLELVGRYITSHPDFGVKYFEKVAERIKDTGVSVLKRAIKFTRDMCTADPNFSEFTNACIIIISRICDEESSIHVIFLKILSEFFGPQDLVCKTFYEFWFDDSSSSQTRSFGDGSCVPIEVAKKTEQIVEMQRRMKDNQLLVTVVKCNLALDFFTADSRGVAQLLESIVFAIDSVLPLAPRIPQAVVEELEQDLKQMIVRRSFLTIVHACIKCLCTVSRVAGKGARVVGYLIHVFFKRLDALGFDNKQALGYVLVSRPEFMLEKDIGKILEATLHDIQNLLLQMQSLQNLYEYLLDAESRMGTDNSDNNEVAYSVEGGQSVPVAAGAGDTNICGGIVQLYWESILGRCLDEVELVRRSALKVNLLYQS
ncbi:hypothetical protein DCAR_0833140 [Daucus carota subsp. sativus]|uniref:Uncharacterized protein n=1 Tax=Daucus carota subsp. sativus TaxID=79200 RepID=A0A175YQQ5_DAUCS|nr:hypothetical protein DCAR_0833140 [Daucus carota subsp. sativus]